ncbi:metal-sensing transcriptional repressor [Neobacillus mesonae]|uniref:metal-sensing transcriptional repressor n=1 Tax=Neobacillus mesonae TaxID=1193713 RepID=UPI00203FDCEE|nr:metal-sensing transcriptional repressor [Neobacillus mesonae]MCM3571247.1 metal-sensing transcriptional repressor [Neobacillus mesonae]
MDENGQIKNRVKRMDGQVRGILKMMEENKDCTQVITQLFAASIAIDRTIGVVVRTNLSECIQSKSDQGEKSTEEWVKEAINVLLKYDRKRIDNFIHLH